MHEVIQDNLIYLSVFGRLVYIYIYLVHTVRLNDLLFKSFVTIAYILEIWLFSVITTAVKSHLASILPYLF